MEQSSRYTATTQHRIRAVQTTSKDISFWRDCSALVTFCLWCAVYKLTYSLTHSLSRYLTEHTTSLFLITLPARAA